MKRIAIAFGFVLATATLLGVRPALGATLNVCPLGCPYSSIQTAITAAAPGDTISVGAGTYNPAGGRLVVNKSVTIIAADPNNKPVVNMNYTSWTNCAVQIEADNVVIDGLDINNSAQFGSSANYILGDYGGAKNGWSIRNSKIHGGLNAIRAIGNGITIENNDLYGTKGDQINCEYGTCYGLKVKGNYLHSDLPYTYRTNKPAGVTINVFNSAPAGSDIEISYNYCWANRTCVDIQNSSSGGVSPSGYKVIIAHNTMDWKMSDLPAVVNGTEEALQMSIAWWAGSGNWNGPGFEIRDNIMSRQKWYAIADTDSLLVGQIILNNNLFWKWYLNDNYYPVNAYPNEWPAARGAVGWALMGVGNEFVASSTNVTADPLYVAQTSTPDRYYALNVGSPARNAASDGQNIGAWQGSSTLHIIKNVVNNNGGTSAAGLFNLHVKLSGVDVAGSPAAGSAAPGTSYSLTPGTYAVSEDVNNSYALSFSGDCDAGGNITLASGDDKACTITNDDIAVAASPTSGGGISYGTINVIKTVINDNGGTKTTADFPLFVNDSPVISGQTNNYPALADTYIVTETADPNYTQTFSGDCNSTGRMDLYKNIDLICIVTNDDIGEPAVVPPVPPLIDVVKVPSPLSLPAGPGAVTYTYTLRNIGTVPVTDVTMVGDTCAPITLESGDINADAKLDVNETWIYRCSTTLTETHTNTVVATGRANGISTTDIASARVVVGEPAVPPLIHVTKIPSPLTLPAEGGTVTYTETVTNPGTVALNYVQLTDDACSPVKYISGDINGDSQLDTSETWVYICRTMLTKTTNNTAIVRGEANGIVVRDFAISTVVVSAPAIGQQVLKIVVNLWIGTRGSSVKILQQFLISQNKGPSARFLATAGATAFFGVRTRAALAEFQAKVGIRPAWGYFGAITRAFLRTHSL